MRKLIFAYRLFFRHRPNTGRHVRHTAGAHDLSPFPDRGGCRILFRFASSSGYFFFFFCLCFLSEHPPPRRVRVYRSSPPPSSGVRDELHVHHTGFSLTPRTLPRPAGHYDLRTTLRNNERREKHIIKRRRSPPPPALLGDYDFLMCQTIPLIVMYTV